MYRVLFGPVIWSPAAPVCSAGTSNADQWMTWQTCSIDIYLFHALYVIIILCCIVLSVQTLYCLHTYLVYACSGPAYRKPLSTLKRLQLLLICMQLTFACLLAVDIGMQISGVQQYQMTNKNILTCFQSFAMSSTLSIGSNVWVHVNLDVARSVNANLDPRLKLMLSKDKLVNRATVTLLVVHLVMNVLCYLVPLIVAHTSTDRTAIDIVYAWCLNVWLMYMWLTVTSCGFRSTYSAYLLRTALLAFDTERYGAQSVKSVGNAALAESVLDVVQLNDNTLTQESVLSSTVNTQLSSGHNVQYKRQSSELVMQLQLDDTTQLHLHRAQSIPMQCSQQQPDEAAAANKLADGELASLHSADKHVCHSTDVDTSQVALDQQLGVSSALRAVSTDSALQPTVDPHITSFRATRQARLQSRHHVYSSATYHSCTHLASTRAEYKRHRLRMISVSKLTAVLLLTMVFILPFVFILPILAYSEQARLYTYILYNILLITLVTYNILMNLMLQPSYTMHRSHTRHSAANRGSDVDIHGSKHHMSRHGMVSNAAMQRNSTILSPSRSVRWLQSTRGADQHCNALQLLSVTERQVATSHTLAHGAVSTTARQDSAGTTHINDVQLEFEHDQQQ